jgi:transposase
MVSTMSNGTMGKRSRRSFTDEFKAGAVRLVIDEGKTVPQVARDLDLTASAVRKWVDQARADRGKGKPGALTTEERVELSRLRKEVRELRMERDILKNETSRPGAAPFARETPFLLASVRREAWPSAYWGHRSR